MQETAVIVMCRCGWTSFGRNARLVCDEYVNHAGGRLGHESDYPLAASNPVSEGAVSRFLTDQAMRGKETRGLDHLERWRNNDQMWNDERVDGSIGDDATATMKGFAVRCVIIGAVLAACLLGWWLR